MQLTKRDKTLLYILAIIVTLAIFIPLVILPQWNKYGKLADKLEEKEQKVQQMKTEIQGISTNNKLLEEKRVQFESTMKDYYPMMESESIERTITKMALDQGLSAKDLDVSTKPFNSELYPYFASGLAQELGMTDLEAAQTAAKKDGETVESEESKDAKEAAQTILYSSKVKASVVGKRENMEKLIDTIYSNYPAIRIAGYEIGTDTILKADSSVSETSTLTLSLEIYMCQK